VPTPVPTPTPVLTIADTQGIWRSAAGTAISLSAIVLPNGTTWVLTSGGASSHLLKGSLEVQSGSLAGTGKDYTLGTSTVESVTLAASVVAKTSLNASLAIAAAAAQSFGLTYQARYDTAATLADFTGSWTSPAGSSVVLTWTVTAGPNSATIAGTSTTGCTYAGTFSLRSESKAVVDAALNETCAGAVKQFAGVAVRSDNTAAGVTTPGAVLLLTSTTGPDEALALILGK